MKYWSGTIIDKLENNQIFVFGSNPEGIHGAGSAKAAVSFGAQYGNGRGIQGSTYAVVTKNLNAGFTEKSTGITYKTDGYCSVSPEQIRANIDELYEYAKNNPDKEFLITYQYESWPNGTPKKSLNGYTSEETLQMFARTEIPPNIVFHDSYKGKVENAIKSIVEQNVISQNESPQYTYFFHLSSPFSNFHPSRFQYKEFTFVSNEQFMMFSKAKVFKDEETANKILEFNNTPLLKDFLDGKITREQIIKDKDLSDQWNKLMVKIKGLGREVKNFDEPVWNAKRGSVVLFGARAKFTQNEDLKQIFLATGDTLMVEASKYDKIWGIGLSEYDAKKTTPDKWPGLNLLGRVLDRLKLEFKSELDKRPKP